jgi:hypothetical protein
MCKKVGGLGGVEAFKVRSPRCWPINAHKVSEAWQDPPRLGLSDMSSQLSCKRGKPPDVSQEGTSASIIHFKNLFKSSWVATRWSVPTSRTLILRRVGHLCLLFTKWDGELLSIGLLLTERLYSLRIWMHACFVIWESFWHFTAGFTRYDSLLLEAHGRKRLPSIRKYES